MHIDMYRTYVQFYFFVVYMYILKGDEIFLRHEFVLYRWPRCHRRPSGRMALATFTFWQLTAVSLSSLTRVHALLSDSCARSRECSLSPFPSFSPPFFLARSPARSVSLLLDCLIYVRMPLSLCGARARSVSFRVDSFIYMRMCLYLSILSYEKNPLLWVHRGTARNHIQFCIEACIISSAQTSLCVISNMGMEDSLLWFEEMFVE